MSQVYRGSAEYAHIQDGHRADIGKRLAVDLNNRFRDNAGAWDDKPLCPGCYMVVLFNAAIETAKRNGQSLSELGNSLGAAFLELAKSPDDSANIEGIVVRLDSDPCPIEE